MRVDADQLLADIAEITAWSDEHDRAAKRRKSYGDRRGRGIYFQKATGSDDDEEPNEHAQAKAEHHGKLGALYQRIAGQHRSMADHYSGGAKGAHTDDGEDDDQPVRSPIQQADEPSDADADAIKVLKAAGLDVEARLALAELNKRAVHDCLAQPQLSDPSAASFHRVLRGTR
jgi:hypothetical protein